MHRLEIDIHNINLDTIATDDLLVSPDFYSYFSALRFLLDSDPSVWCISAWNDNGKDGYISIEENGKEPIL